MNKISIIGAGNVGATAAMFIAMSSNENAQIVLLDIKDGVAEGKAADINQMFSTNYLTPNACCVAGVTNDYSATANSDIIVITSGVPRKPGMTREELVGVNSKVLKSVLDNVSKLSPDAIYIVVSNPMDTMAYFTYKYLGIASNRVIGMGGLLDSARLRYYLAKALNDSRVNGYVVGGHGDTTMIPLPASIVRWDNNYNLVQVPKDVKASAIKDTMLGGATLTNLIGTSAWVAPAKCIEELTHSIINDNPLFCTCSYYHPDSDVFIGDFCVVSANGVSPTDKYRIFMDGDSEVISKFTNSIEAIKSVNSSLPL